jgi:hypothetical protein
VKSPGSRYTYRLKLDDILWKEYHSDKPIQAEPSTEAHRRMFASFYNASLNHAAQSFVRLFPVMSVGDNDSVSVS